MGGSSQWDEYAERLRQQLPTAPESLIEIYVQWAPWIAMIFGAIGIILSIGFLFLGAVISPFLVLGGGSGVNAGIGLFVAIVLLAVSSILELVGGYLMKAMSLTGWWLIAVGLGVGILQNLIHVSVFGLIITLLIGYVHIAVKPRYA